MLSFNCSVLYTIRLHCEKWLHHVNCSPANMLSQELIIKVVVEVGNSTSKGVSKRPWSLAAMEATIALGLLPEGASEVEP